MVLDLGYWTVAAPPIRTHVTYAYVAANEGGYANGNVLILLLWKL